MANSNPGESVPFSGFKEAYDTLRNTADELRSQNEPDIDHLATKVVRAVEAYKECESRITAVEKALEGVFAREDVKSPAPGGAAAVGEAASGAPKGETRPQGEKPAPKAGGKFDDFEDDIPSKESM